MTEVAAQRIPTKRANGVAAIDGQQREQKQPPICLGDRVRKFREAEVLGVHHPAGAIRQHEEHGKDQNRKEELAKIPTHSSARLSGRQNAVKKRGG